MLLRSLVFPMLLAGGLQAQEGLSAADVFRKAVEAQGRVRHAQIEDVFLEFNGHIQQEGVHSILRTYRYRTRDRSFRIVTQSKADPKRRTENGVLGANGYWERDDGRILALNVANKEHRKSIRSIDKSRREFERILRLVLLTRLEGDETTIRLGTPPVARLQLDAPFEARHILGDQAGRKYYVLDVERKDSPRFRLYVRTGDFTVRKAIEFGREDPEEPKYHYYFGPFEKDAGALALTVPVYFTMHAGLPTDEESREKTNKARGKIKLRLNTGLEDADLKPPG